MTTLTWPTISGRKNLNLQSKGPGVSLRYGVNGHTGIDFFWLSAATAAKYGTTSNDSKIEYAAAPGVVEQVTTLSDYGNVIKIKVTDQASVRYCHQASKSGLAVGSQVSTSTVVGTMGQTGSLAIAGIHLHFEVWIKGSRVDPWPYLNGTQLPGTPVIQPSIAKNQRIAVPAGSNRRTKPYVEPSTFTGTGVKGGEVGRFKGFVMAPAPDGSRIDTVDGSSVWLVGAGDGAYFHISGWTDRSTHDLPDLTAQLFPAPKPPAEPEPEPEPTEPEEPVEEEPPVEIPGDPTPPDEGGEPEGPTPPVDESPSDDPPTSTKNPVLAAVVGVVGLLGILAAALWSWIESL